MDFTKLVSLLHRQSLHFVRSDRLDDPFEGSYPRANLPLKEAFEMELSEHIGDKAEMIVENTENFRRMARIWIYLNSWHMNDHESAAMWKVYAQTKEAVAVRSTYASLRKVLPDRINIGTVQYIDFESQPIPEVNVLYPFMYKRMSYSHERELRALIFQVVDEHDQVINDPDLAPKGTYVEVDVDELVHSIYVAPGSPAWFREVVAGVCSTYGLEKEVFQSSIDDEPFY